MWGLHQAPNPADYCGLGGLAGGRVGVSYIPTGSRKINVTNAVYLLRFYGRLGIYLSFVYSCPIKISSGQEAYLPFRSISLKMVWEYTLSHLINLKMDFIFLGSVRIR